MVSEFKERWAELKQFLFHDVWDIDVSSMSAKQSFPIRIVRVAQLVFKGFKEDDLPVHASALTFVTLMSLVPMLAVVFALLKGFGFGQQKIAAMVTWIESMPEEFQMFMDQVLGIVHDTNFAALGWVGLGFVLFTAVLVLGSVESSFNRIWGVTTPRSVFRKVSNYITLLVLVPVLIGIASTIQTTVNSSASVLPETVGAVLKALLGLTSFSSTLLAFFFLYKFLPNTRVRVLPVIFGSVVGALLWILWQKAFITLQFGVARYNAIYGTFASVPIFLAWLYTSWVIVLLGAELTFALQNSATFQIESSAQNASAKSRFMLTLSVMLSAAEAMTGEKTQFRTSDFAKERQVPIRLLNDVLRMLMRFDLLAEIAGKEASYTLIRSPESIRVKDVFDLVAEEGTHPEKLGMKDLGPAVESVLGHVDEGISSSLENMTLQDLVKLNATTTAT